MGKFYVTTPIYYVTAKPHIGHAYTTVIADILARWHRLKGEKVFFLTGTDEHGGKVEKYAADAGKSPKEFVDDVANSYKFAWDSLNISYDKFIRTTDKEHEVAVQRFANLIWDNGDIYKSKYEGWYCLPDETFIPDSEITDEKCPYCGRPVQRLQEDAFFFSLSRYREPLLRVFDENKTFLMPKSRYNEILNRLNDELKDLDITRKSVKWGIQFPPSPDHTIYVWFDALLNYISALGWPDGENFKEFWPADVHVVGKEIAWFHSVIWPAMLLAGDISLPKAVLSHGWWTVDGKKMSKSLGNVVDPMDIIKRYSEDAFRYFLIKEKPIWEDGDFSEKALVSRINGELVADLGNLVSRVLTLASRYKGEIAGDIDLENADIDKISSLFDSFDVTGALEEVWKFIRSVNKYINDKEPWKLEGAELGRVLNNSLEAIRVIAILLEPFMPASAVKIREQLGVRETKFSDIKLSTFNGSVKRGENLFKKYD